MFAYDSFFLCFTCTNAKIKAIIVNCVFAPPRYIGGAESCQRNVAGISYAFGVDTFEETESESSDDWGIKRTGIAKHAAEGVPSPVGRFESIDAA